MTAPTSLKVHLLIAAIALFSSATTIAETIKIPVGQQSTASELARPLLGMSKDSVEKQYGSPDERIAAKGVPPISRWIYSDFVVYFESDTVIHSVIKHKPQESTE